MKRLLLILCVMLASPAWADRAGDGGSNGGGARGGSAERHDGEVDHDSAREAVARHEILPLKRVLADVRRRYGGRVIEVELERKRGRYFYEIKLITRDGHILEVEVDAATGVASNAPAKARNEKDD